MPAIREDFPAEAWPEPVSYTHLDVYKRQLQAGIFPENEASVALHLGRGFRVIGRRERVACHYGVWRDALLLERRSRSVGVGDE